MVRVIWLVLAIGCRAGFESPPGDTMGELDAPRGCVAPYTQTADGCFRFEPATRTWLDAEQDCEDDAPDAHLAVVGTVDEHYAIHALSQAGQDIWLGYTDRVAEGTMVWLTPTGLDPTGNPCFFGSAVNSAGADCVTQDGTSSCGDWFYRDCNSLHAYVCERDGAPVPPGRY